MRWTFFAERDVAKVPSLATDTPVRDIRAVGVIGGGTMGRADAICCADAAGLPVTLVEADKLALDRALASLRTHYSAAVKRGRLKADEMEKRLARISGTMLLSDLGGADLIIEAVTEDLTLKRKIFGEIDLIAKPDALLATNTSYLDIDLLASATQQPERVLGLHFCPGDDHARDGSRAGAARGSDGDRHRHGFRAQDPQAAGRRRRLRRSSAIAS